MNNAAGPSAVKCGYADCFAAFDADLQLSVRDLWARKDLAKITAKDGLELSVQGGGAAAMVRVTPLISIGANQQLEDVIV